MAESLQKLVFQIQGDIDDTFGGAIKDMTGQLNQLDGEIKNIANSKMKPDAISAEYLKLNKEAAGAARELAKLNGQMKLVDGFSKQNAAAAEAEKKFRDARAEVERLEEAQKNSGTKAFTAELKAAKKEAAAAERAYNKEAKTLADMDKNLKNAGVDTDRLGEEQARLAAEIEKAKEKSDSLGKSLANLVKAKYYFKELTGHAKQLGSDLMWVGKTWLKMGAAVSAGGFALFKISDSVAAVGDAAAKSAAKLHMTAESFQELKYAADLSGVKDFDAMMVKLNANTAKFAKDDKAAKRLAEYGINAKQLAKLKPDVAVMYLADKLNEIKDPARRARAELDLFGKSGAEMGAFLGLGSKEIQKLRDEANETGLVIPGTVAAQAEAFNDARDKMMGSISGLKNIVGAELMPVFTDLFGEFTEFFVGNKDTVKDFANNLGVKFKEALPVLKELTAGAAGFIGGLWDVAKAVTNLVGGTKNLGAIIAALPLAKPIVTIGKLAWSFGGLLKSLGAVKGAIFTVGKALVMNPVGAAIAAIAVGALLIYKYWEPIKAFFINVFEKARAAVVSAKESIVNAFDVLPGWIKGPLSLVADSIMMPFKIGYQFVKATIGYFKGDFKSVPEALSAAFSGVFDIISEPFNKAFAWVGDKWESLKSAFGFGPKIEIPKPVVAGTPLRSRARGGMYSAPTVTEFAERGPEVAVPVGLADRGLGLSNLKIAARALGLGDMKAGAPDAGTTALDRGLRAPNAKEKAGRPPDKINVTISCDPQISIIANGSSQEEVRRAAIEALREFGAKMIPEWREQIARTAYVTG